MGKVTTGASMSLDGYIAGPADSGFDQLFQWYDNGDVAVPTAQPDFTFTMTPISAEHWRKLLDRLGSLIVGRRLFDLTNGWGGTHPIGKPVVVLTHKAPDGFESKGTPFTFVSSGIEEAVAVARELAGDREVGLNGGTIARQGLEAGLLDEVWIDLVPVLLGDGTPFFDHLSNAPAVLDGPFYSVQGERVTHLAYSVRR